MVWDLEFEFPTTATVSLTNLPKMIESSTLFFKLEQIGVEFDGGFLRKSIYLVKMNRLALPIFRLELYLDRNTPEVA